MPTIAVISLSNVTIDGIPSGSVLDVPANHTEIDGIKSLVLAALLAWDAARTQAHAEEVAGLQAQIVTLGGTELAQSLAKAAQVKAAQDALAKAQADLAALSEAQSP